jgi:hypothetical protein
LYLPQNIDHSKVYKKINYLRTYHKVYEHPLDEQRQTASHKAQIPILDENIPSLAKSTMIMKRAGMTKNPI